MLTGTAKSDRIIGLQGADTLTLRILDFGFWILLGTSPTPSGWKNLKDALYVPCGTLRVACFSEGVRGACRREDSQSKIPKPRTLVVGVNPKDAPASLTLRYRKSKILALVDSHGSDRTWADIILITAAKKNPLLGDRIIDVYS